MVGPLPPVTNTTNTMDPTALRRARLDSEKARLARLAELEKAIGDSAIEAPAKDETAGGFWSRLGRNVGKGASALLSGGPGRMGGSEQERANVENANGFWRKQLANMTDEMELLRKIMLPLQAISVSGGAAHQLTTGGAHPATLPLGPLGARVFNKLFHDAEASADRVERARETMGIIGKGFAKTAGGDLGALADTAGELREMEEKSPLSEQFIYGAIFDPTILLGPVKFASMGAKVGAKAASRVGLHGASESLYTWSKWQNKATTKGLEEIANAFKTAPTRAGREAARAAARAKGIAFTEVNEETLIAAELDTLLHGPGRAVREAVVDVEDLSPEELLRYLEEDYGSASLYGRGKRRGQGFLGFGGVNRILRTAEDVAHKNVEDLQDLLAKGFDKDVRKRLRDSYGKEKAASIEAHFVNRMKVLPKEGDLLELYRQSNVMEVYRAAHGAKSSLEGLSPLEATLTLREMYQQDILRDKVARLGNALSNHFLGKDIFNAPLTSPKRLSTSAKRAANPKSRWAIFADAVNANDTWHAEWTARNGPISADDYNAMLDPYFIQDRAMLALLRVTGARHTELLHMDWENVLSVLDSATGSIDEIMLGGGGYANRGVRPVYDRGGQAGLQGVTKAQLKDALEAYKVMLWGTEEVPTGKIFGSNKAQYKGMYKYISMDVTDWTPRKPEGRSLGVRIRELFDHYDIPDPADATKTISYLPSEVKDYRTLMAQWMRLNEMSQEQVVYMLGHGEESRSIAGIHYTQALTGNLTSSDFVLATHLGLSPAGEITSGPLFTAVLDAIQAAKDIPKLAKGAVQTGQRKGRYTGQHNIRATSIKFGDEILARIGPGTLEKEIIEAARIAIADRKAWLATTHPRSAAEIRHYDEGLGLSGVLRNDDELRLYSEASRLASINVSLVPAIDNVISVTRYHHERVGIDLKEVTAGIKGRQTKKAKGIVGNDKVLEELTVREADLKVLKTVLGDRIKELETFEGALGVYVDAKFVNLENQIDDYIKSFREIGDHTGAERISKILREKIQAARTTVSEYTRTRRKSAEWAKTASRNRRAVTKTLTDDPFIKSGELDNLMNSLPQPKSGPLTPETRKQVGEVLTEFVNTPGIRNFLQGRGWSVGGMDIKLIKKTLTELAGYRPVMFGLGEKPEKAALKARVQQMAEIIHGPDSGRIITNPKGESIKFNAVRKHVDPVAKPDSEVGSADLKKPAKWLVGGGKRGTVPWNDLNEAGEQVGYAPSKKFFSPDANGNKVPTTTEVLGPPDEIIERSLNPDHHLAGVISSPFLRRLATAGVRASQKLERFPGFGSNREGPGYLSEPLISLIMGGSSATNTEAGRLVAALRNIWRGTSDVQDRVVSASFRAMKRAGFTFEPAVGTESRPFFSKPRWVGTLVEGTTSQLERPTTTGSSTFFPRLNDAGKKVFEVRNLDPVLEQTLQKRATAFFGPDGTENFIEYHMRSWDMVMGEVPIERLRFDKLTNPDGFYWMTDEMYDFILYQRRLIEESEALIKKANEAWGIDLTKMMEGQRDALAYAPRAALGRHGVTMDKASKAGDVMQPQLDWTKERKHKHYAESIGDGTLFEDGIQTLAHYTKSVQQTIATERVKQLLFESGELVDVKGLQNQVKRSGNLFDYFLELRGGKLPSEGLIKAAHKADKELATQIDDVMRTLPEDSTPDALLRQQEQIERLGKDLQDRWVEAQKKLIPDVVEGKKSPLEGGQLRSLPLEANWLQDVYLTEDAWRQVKRLTETDTNFIMNLATAAKGPSQLIRFLKSGFDLGVGFIHGWQVLFKDHKMWARAQKAGVMALWNPEYYQDFLLRDPMGRQRKLDHGLMLSRSEVTEYFDNPARFGAGLTDNPTSRRFVSSFNANLDMLRSELFDALEGQQINKLVGGRKTLTREELFEVSAVANKMTGTYNPGLAGVSQNIATMQSSLLFFAPLYRRAVFGMLTDATLGLVGRGGLRGREARKVMGKMALVGIIAMGMAAALKSAMGGKRGKDVWTGDESFNILGVDLPSIFTEEQKEMFDPSSPKFMSIDVDGHHIGIGTAFYSMFRLVGSMHRTFSGVVEEGRDGQAWEKFTDIPDNLFFRWFRGQSAPTTGLLIDIVTGRNFLGDPLLDGGDPNVSNISNHTWDTLAPFWLDHENILGNGLGGKVAVVSEFFGFRSFPLSVYDKASQEQDFWVQNSQIPDIVEWRGEQTSADDLEWANLPVLLQRILREEHPEIEQAEEAISQLKLTNGGEHDKAFIRFTELNDTNRKLLRDTLQEIDDKWAKGEYPSGKAFRETYSSALRDHRTRAKQLSELPDYQQVLVTLNRKRNRRLEKGEGHIGDLMFDYYAATVLGADLTDEDGNFNHDNFKVARRDVLEKFYNNLEAMEYVEKRLEQGKDLDSTPSIKMYEAAKTTLADYWKLHYNKWGETSNNALIIDEYIARGSSRNQGAWLRKYPQHRKLIRQWDKLKRIHRKNNPNVDVALVMFYDAAPTTRAGKEALMFMQPSLTPGT